MFLFRVMIYDLDHASKICHSYGHEKLANVPYCQPQLLPYGRSCTTNHTNDNCQTPSPSDDIYHSPIVDFIKKAYGEYNEVLGQCSIPPPPAHCTAKCIPIKTSIVVLCASPGKALDTRVTTNPTQHRGRVTS